MFSDIIKQHDKMCHNFVTKSWRNNTGLTFNDSYVDIDRLRCLVKPDWPTEHNGVLIEQGGYLSRLHDKYGNAGILRFRLWYRGRLYEFHVAGRAATVDTMIDGCIDWVKANDK